MARPRHKRKDIEVVLVDAEAHGWRIETRTKGYLESVLRLRPPSQDCEVDAFRPELRSKPDGLVQAHLRLAEGEPVSFYVEIELIVDEDGSSLDAAALDRLTDELMPLVVDLPDDVDLAADAARSSVTFCVSLDAPTPRAALESADAIAIAAMKELGMTPHFTEVAVSARRTELVGA